MNEMNQYVSGSLNVPSAPFTGAVQQPLLERVNDAIGRCHEGHLNPLRELRELLERNPDVARILDLRAQLYL